jgi:hypothetical protein
MPSLANRELYPTDWAEAETGVNADEAAPSGDAEPGLVDMSLHKADKIVWQFLGGTSATATTYCYNEVADAWSAMAVWSISGNDTIEQESEGGKCFVRLTAVVGSYDKWWRAAKRGY